MLVSGSIPSPTQGGDVPGNSNADVPGANEDEEEFQHNDAQVAKSIQDSQKARHSQDIETIFTDIIDEDGKKFWICWCRQDISPMCKSPIWTGFDPLDVPHSL